MEKTISLHFDKKEKQAEQEFLDELHFSYAAYGFVIIEETTIEDIIQIKLLDPKDVIIDGMMRINND